MKNLFFFAITLIFTGAAFGQTVEQQTESVPNAYSDTVNVTATKSQIYARAKEYFATTTSTTKNEVQMDDKDLGRIISKSKTVDDVSLNGLINLHFEIFYTTAISVKVNKYKFIISDIYYDKTNVTPIKADNMIKKVIIELKNFMNSKSAMDF